MYDYDNYLHTCCNYKYNPYNYKDYSPLICMKIISEKSHCKQHKGFQSNAAAFVVNHPTWQGTNLCIAIGKGSKI